MNTTIERYGRINIHFNRKMLVDSVEYKLPDGSIEQGPVFEEIPVSFTYDVHGYETVEPAGERCIACRYTPRMTGKYHWRALRVSDVVQEGSFECVKSAGHGYIGISQKDSRYFAHTDGTPYVPIGLNLVAPDHYSLPADSGHFNKSHSSATPGCLTYKRWFRELSENGGNYARLWLSSAYFEARTETPNAHNLFALARLDAVVELARQYGIKLKMCLEHFRTFTNTNSFFYRKMRDPETGEVTQDIEKWFNDKRWNEIWLQDISPYLARYWNDPIVFSWELWNEIECGDTCFESVKNWTQRMLPEIRSRSPRNLVTNSLGSFDVLAAQERQDAFRDMAENDFQQVHRYLDQGAPLEICRRDPVAFSIDAVKQCRRADKPIILTETGAVNDRHTGPFRFHGSDHDGIIFHDVTYPAFFAGAAGSGHIWHWSEYVEQKNLWKYYLPFKNMLDGLVVDEENFKAEDFSTDSAWVLALTGKKHCLIYIRSKASCWDSVLRDNIQPQLLTGMSLDMPCRAACKLFWLFGENPGAYKVEDGKLRIPAFRYGCIVRMTF